MRIGALRFVWAIAAALGIHAVKVAQQDVAPSGLFIAEFEMGYVRFLVVRPDILIAHVW